MGVQTTAPMIDKVLALQPSVESLLELERQFYAARLISALSFHGITTQVPRCGYLAVSRGRVCGAAPARASGEDLSSDAAKCDQVNGASLIGGALLALLWQRALHGRLELRCQPGPMTPPLSSLANVSTAVILRFRSAAIGN
jgi:hypothetical protein